MEKIPYLNVIHKGFPLWLFNLAGLIATVFQEDVTMTGPYLQYPDLSITSLTPLLQGLPRYDAQGNDQRACITWSWARTLGLVKTVPDARGGYKVYCRPGDCLARWSEYDLVLQSRHVLQAWVRSVYWADALGNSISQWESRVSFIPDTFTQEARQVLLDFVQQLVPGRWYEFGSLETFLYTHHANVLNSHLTSSYGEAFSRSSGFRSPYLEWQQREGRCFAGMLVSLRELGMISLGYQQDPGDNVSRSLRPDLFQLTSLGHALLSTRSWQEEPVEEENSSSPPAHLLDIQGDFDLLLPTMDAGIADLCRLLSFSKLQHIGASSRLSLTMSSIRRGLQYGVNIDQMLRTLAALSRTEIPKRTISAMREWGRADDHVSAGHLLPSAAPPQLIDAGTPLLLFDLAVLLGTLYQEPIVTTERGTLPKRLVKKLRPMLHGRPRMNEAGEDDYLLIVLELATYHNLMSKSQPSHWGKSVRYEHNTYLRFEKWKSSTLLLQMQEVVEWWISAHSFHWQDVPGPQFSLWIKSDWNPRVARTLLLNYLQECEIGQWYHIDSLVAAIWERDPHALRPARLNQSSDGASRHRKLTREHWSLCDGELYRGILTSSLFEMGIVSLGRYFEEWSGPKDRRDAPDTFCVTDLGGIVLDRWHGKQVRGKEVPSVVPRIVVQPTFEILLLQPDMVALYSVLPFVQIVQIAQISKLALTQASVSKAFALGWTCEKILFILSELSLKELPQNVIYTLREWARKDREVPT